MQFECYSFGLLDIRNKVKTVSEILFSSDTKYNVQNI